MTVRMKLTGPLVTGRGKTILNRAIALAVRDLTNAGVERLNKVLRPRPAGVFKSAAAAGPNVSRGNYRRHVRPIFREKNTFITDGGVIYGAWLEGVSSRNAASKFKGYASFRRTKTWLDKKAPEVLKVHKNRLIKKLGGGTF